LAKPSGIARIKMPHSYNKKAFGDGIVATSPLLSLYASLVIIELRIKDTSAPWRGGHRVIEWLASLGETSLAQQLRTALAKLHCTDRSGGQAPVDGNTYPDLRYLRHETDFAGTSTDVQILDALQIVESINAALRVKGVL
jgi:hypothetical protein